MKGYSLHVGVGAVNPAHYSDELRLFGAKNDALALRQKALSSGIYSENTSHCLINENATSGNFFAALNHIQAVTQTANEACYVLMSFSGHGASHLFPGMTNTLQFLCFHDRLVLEYEITHALRAFSSNCKVFVILDACYSEGTSTENRADQEDESA